MCQLLPWSPWPGHTLHLQKRAAMGAHRPHWSGNPSPASACLTAKCPVQDPKRPRAGRLAAPSPCLLSSGRLGSPLVQQLQPPLSFPELTGLPPSPALRLSEGSQRLACVDLNQFLELDTRGI